MPRRSVQRSDRQTVSKIYDLTLTHTKTHYHSTYAKTRPNPNLESNPNPYPNQKTNSKTRGKNMSCRCPRFPTKAVYNNLPRIYSKCIKGLRLIQLKIEKNDTLKICIYSS